LAHAEQQKVVSFLQGAQELGGLFGRILMAILAVRVLSRKRLCTFFQIPGLLLIPLVVFLPAVRDADMSSWGIFALGVVSVAQFSFWEITCHALSTYLRGTGESFAANVGGRMLGTSAALITTTIVLYMPGGTVTRQLAYAAGTVGFLAYAIGFIASFWLPEPRQDAIPTRPDISRGVPDLVCFASLPRRSHCGVQRSWVAQASACVLPLGRTSNHTAEACCYGVAPELRVTSLGKTNRETSRVLLRNSD